MTIKAAGRPTKDRRVRAGPGEYRPAEPGGRIVAATTGQSLDAYAFPSELPTGRWGVEAASNQCRIPTSAPTVWLLICAVAFTAKPKVAAMTNVEPTSSGYRNRVRCRVAL